MLAGVMHATAMRLRGSEAVMRLRLGYSHCCASRDPGRGDTAQLCSTRPTERLAQK